MASGENGKGFGENGKITFDAVVQLFIYALGRQGWVAFRHCGPTGSGLVAFAVAQS